MTMTKQCHTIVRMHTVMSIYNRIDEALNMLNYDLTIQVMNDLNVFEDYPRFILCGDSSGFQIEWHINGHDVEIEIFSDYINLCHVNERREVVEIEFDDWDETSIQTIKSFLELVK